MIPQVPADSHCPCLSETVQLYYFYAHPINVIANMALLFRRHFINHTEFTLWIQTGDMDSFLSCLKINWSQLHAGGHGNNVYNQSSLFERSHDSQWQENRLLWWRSRCEAGSQEWPKLSISIHQMCSCCSRTRSKLWETEVVFACSASSPILVVALQFSLEGVGRWITLSLHDSGAADSEFLRCHMILFWPMRIIYLPGQWLT